MSDDGSDFPRAPTPPHGTSVWATDDNCKTRHERSNKVASDARTVAYQNRERLIGIVGIDGGPGRLGILEKDMAETESWIKQATDTLHDIQRKQDRQGVKIGIIVAVAGAVAGIIASVVVKLTLGG